MTSTTDAAGLCNEEAKMISLPDDWFLYLAAGAMGFFMIVMVFATISERRNS